MDMKLLLIRLYKSVMKKVLKLFVSSLYTDKNHVYEPIPVPSTLHKILNTK